MGWVMRLYEKLTGIAHRHDNADRVARAADGLTDSIRELSATLKPYRESDDPLVALMTDVFNRRQLRDRRDKLHS
jgi:hypothetical protein